MARHTAWSLGRFAGILVLATLAGLPARAAEGKPLEFHLTFDPKVTATPFTGRVYVMLSKQETKTLRSGPSWFNPEPFFARDVKDWKPGETVVIGADGLACPAPLPQLPKDTYSVQAVMDFDRGARSFATAEGNGYSEAVRLPLDPAATGPVRLVLDRVYQPRPFPESDRVKLVDIESKLLSEFHGRPVRLRAGVVLPKSLADNPEKRYPVIYEIPGFGGNHFGALRRTTSIDVAGVEMLYVVLDPDCRWGHHVFADSDNNGPCGKALVEELIPHLEKKYRALGVPTARFVTGHSSGGWSSLWLQVTYADFFGGVWSTAPDEVDFRSFSNTNIYQPGVNYFVDDEGKPRATGRRKGKAVLFNRPFSDMEEVMGHGGQFGSFESVFSPRGPDGRPKRLWDRKTGAVDPEVARSWERYDIRLVLERNWKTLGPKLAGKVRVYMGEEDTFYLEQALKLLKESLDKLGSDAVIEFFPGRDHGNLIDAALRRRIAEEMAAQFRKHHAAE